MNTEASINIRFGRAMALRRKEMGLSQEEFGYRCGLHRTYIGALERGEKSPTLETLERLASGLEISIKELWEVLKID